VGVWPFRILIVTPRVTFRYALQWFFPLRRDLIYTNWTPSEVGIILWEKISIEEVNYIPGIIECAIIGK
jgi:hypothetical protein